MNKIEELENRCRQLEDRVETLEKALVALVGRPEKTMVIIEKTEPEFYPLDQVCWYGGQ